jgi:hypothetical protein
MGRNPIKGNFKHYQPLNFMADVIPHSLFTDFDIDLFKSGKALSALREVRVTYDHSRWY